jgi:hypothetical protein
MWRRAGNIPKLTLSVSKISMKDDPVSSRTGMTIPLPFAPGKLRKTSYYRVRKERKNT